MSEFPRSVNKRRSKTNSRVARSTLDAKIELNRRLNAELEAMAKLLYDYWFVQFDFPISAAQAAAMGRPDLEGKPYRASGGKMVLPPRTETRDSGGVGGRKQLLDIANVHERHCLSRVSACRCTAPSRQ
jgi:hypothetical protein